MPKFTERENWITITTIMKTSATSKMLPKEMRDQLFLTLHREFAPSLKDEDIQDIESRINQLSREVMQYSGGEAMKHIGQGDMKETMQQLGSLIGDEKAKEVMDKMSEQNDKNLT